MGWWCFAYHIDLLSRRRRITLYICCLSSPVIDFLPMFFLVSCSLSPLPARYGQCFAGTIRPQNQCHTRRFCKAAACTVSFPSQSACTVLSKMNAQISSCPGEYQPLWFHHVLGNSTYTQCSMLSAAHDLRPPRFPTISIVPIVVRILASNGGLQQIFSA